MRYSIVIPVFKRLKILIRCIESIEKQILKPLEVIIVDNNEDQIEINKLKILIEDINENSISKCPKTKHTDGLIMDSDSRKNGQHTNVLRAF